MNPKKITQYEQILGRKLNEKETQRFLQVQKILEIHDNDALWDMICIMEYYTKFCLDTPVKIESILTNFSENLRPHAEATKSNIISQNLRMSHIFLGGLLAVLFYLLGYFSSQNNFNIFQIIKIFLASSSAILSIIFAKKYVQYALQANKKWFKCVVLAILFLLITLIFLFIL